MVLRSFITPSYSPVARFGQDSFGAFQRALQRSIDDAWQGLPAATTEAASMSIRLDVKEDEAAFHVTADLPGLSESEVEVTFDDGLLTIRGEKKVERDDKKDTWHIVERSYGSFARQLSLPTNISTDKIEAKFEKGVLRVTLPKAPLEQASAKKITVKGG